MDTQKTSIGLGILTAFASSLCCITPLIALLAGTGGFALNFHWINPLRPWLIGVTILALGFAWYQSLKPKAIDDCGCDITKMPFFQSRSFLSLVTIFAIAMMALPLYSGNLIDNPISSNKIPASYDPENIVSVEFEVKGMTCGGCEKHVSDAVLKLVGVLEVSPSYENGNMIVKFNSGETNIEAIKVAAESTGYKVIKHKVLKNIMPSIELTLLEFSVNGMTCSGCEGLVCSAVQELSGIESVSASFKDANTIVKFNPLKTSKEAIEKAIAFTGYKVKLKEN